MSAVATYLKTLTARRTIYALKPELPGEITINDIQSVVQTIIKETPTAFNSQPNRAVILTGETHKKVWDEVTKAIESPAGQKRPASARDEAFGSVIFFTDDKVTEKLKADFPAYAAAFLVSRTIPLVPLKSTRGLPWRQWAWVVTYNTTMVT